MATTGMTSKNNEILATTTTAATPTVMNITTATSSSSSSLTSASSHYLVSFPLILGGSNSAAGIASSSSQNSNPPLPLLVPPLHYSLVSPDIHRSACPSARNFPFLSSLNLHSIVFLSREPYPKEILSHFESEEAITVRTFDICGNKEPFQSSDENAIVAALLYIVDVRHHPVLIHCEKGRHRTGCLVGCLRRCEGRSLSAIYQEYRQFSGTSTTSSATTRDLDRLAIECFDLKKFKKLVKREIPEEFQPQWME